MEKMNGLAEVTACYIYWRECVKRLKMCPWSQACMLTAMVAQMQLVCTQALYWKGDPK